MFEKLWYSWDEFAIDVEKIACAVEKSGKKFTHVYGVPRGGLLLAICLSHRLGLKLLLELPDGRTRFEPMCCALRMMARTPKEVLQLKDSKVLIVDDIADTGRTLRKFQWRGFFIATLFRHPKSTAYPQVAIREKDDRWVVFPWETEASSKYDNTPA